MLWFREDGNLQLYKKYFENGHNIIWETDTAGCDATKLTFKKNGKLVLQDEDKNTTWSSHCELGKGVADRDLLQVKLTDYGSLVASNGPDMVFWCSNTSNKLKTKFFFGHQVHEGTTLFQGQVLMSKNMARRLMVQNDGNLVVYDSRDRAVWSSETSGQGEGPYLLRMQDDANLVLYDVNDTPIWASATDGQGEGRRKAKLTNDGVFKVVDEMGEVLWAVETPLEDWEKEDQPNWQDRLCGQNTDFPSMLPGSFLKSHSGEFTLVFSRDCNLGVMGPDGDIAWVAEINRPGDCFLCVQNDANVVIYTKKDHEALWSTDSYKEDLCSAEVRLIMQDDGNLVVYDHEQNPVWASQ